MVSENIDRTRRTLRLSPELDEEIERLAKEHHRSENAELMVAVEQYVRSQKVCSICSQPADLECKAGKCAPSTWWCSSHYMKKHDPEEGDEE